jgi:putative protease
VGAASAAAGAGAETVAPQYILYKDVPLFMAEACSLTALHGNTCPGSKVCEYRTLSIENEQGEKFEVAHEHCKSIVYSTNAQSLVHRQRDLLDMGIRDFRLDFLTRKYGKDQLFEVLDGALGREERDEEALPNTHVANFDRTLL